MIKDIFKKEILKLKDKPYVDKNILKQFLKRLSLENLIRAQNAADHFCCFFVPVDIKTKQVFAGHHIKADEWIPPGGHIELNEKPIETIQREFKEELGLAFTDQKITLFDIGITLINDPKRPCRIHNDFWYAVFTKKQKLSYDRGEFHTAGWLSIDETIKKTGRKSIRTSLDHLKNFLDRL